MTQQSLPLNGQTVITKKWTAWQVLRDRFPESEYVLIAEVSDASGYQRSRSLDYMIVNLWQSRGLAVTGIEKKSNRGDWLKELKTPEKQENHFKYCDYFYLLTDKEGVAKMEEIPANWGWYHINERGVLKTLKVAPKLESIPIERSLLCAMLRRAACKTKYVHVDSVQEYIQTAAENIQQTKNRTLENEAASYRALQEKVTIFEKHSGISINYSYGPDLHKIGEVVKLIINNGIDDHKKRLIRIQEQIVKMGETASKNILDLEQFTEPVIDKLITSIQIKD